MGRQNKSRGIRSESVVDVFVGRPRKREGDDDHHDDCQYLRNMMEHDRSPLNMYGIRRQAI
jgi:hypothetical protein